MQCQKVLLEGRTRKGPHGVRMRMGADLFAEIFAEMGADLFDMINMEEGRVTLADVINIERQPANPQRLVAESYTLEGKMHIVPIVNYSQRTDEELAEDPVSTVDADMWFMQTDEITLWALPKAHRRTLPVPAGN